MKRGWKILLVLLVVFGTTVGVPAYYHYRAKRAVAAYRAQLRAKGEKLTVSELAPANVEDSLNARADFTNAMARFNRAGPPFTLPMMQTLAPGHVLVTWKEDIAPTDNSSNAWPKLSEQFRTNQAALAGLRASLARPVLDFNLDYMQAWGGRLPHLAYVRIASLWLGSAAVLDLREDRFSNAWDNVSASARLIRIYRSEPWPISVSVRGFITSLAVGVTWQALQYPGWSEEQLAALQRDWEAADLLNQLEPCLALQRAALPESFAEGRDSFTNLESAAWLLQGFRGMAVNDDSIVGDALLNPQAGLKSFVSRYPGYWQWKWWWSYEEEIVALEISQLQLEAARSMRAGAPFAAALQPLIEKQRNLDKFHHNYQVRFRGLSAALELRNISTAVTAMDTQRRLAITAIALERYRVRFGKYPAELGELTPAYLGQVPLDCMDGKPLRYLLNPGAGFLLYSVGEDGRDNGGEAAPPPDLLGRVASRWSWWKAQDAVWPQAATAEESKAYEEKMIRNIKVFPVPPVQVPSPVSTLGTNAPVR